MHDPDSLPPVENPSEAITVRGHTLLIRCWQEKISSDEFVLRGTLRDVSRGRSRPFEGVAALLGELVAMLGLNIPPMPPPGQNGED